MRHFALAVVAAALPWTAFAFQADFSWSGTLNPGQTLEIKDVNGSIRAERAAGNVIEVTARKTAHRSDPASVRIEVATTSDGVTICAVYPGDDASYDCQGGHRGRNSDNRDNDVVVDFAVKVPAGVHFAPKTVNGSVTATSLGSNVDASSVNGNIKVSTSGLVHATTVNGSIDAAMGVASWSDTLKFSTVNGSIDLTLPRGLNADVRATSVSGDVASDFPMTLSGAIGGKHLNGRIGVGGRELKLSTVNGGITLHQGDGRAL